MAWLSKKHSLNLEDFLIHLSGDVAAKALDLKAIVNTDQVVQRFSSPFISSNIAIYSSYHLSAILSKSGNLHANLSGFQGSLKICIYFLDSLHSIIQKIYPC